MRAHYKRLVAAAAAAVVLGSGVATAQSVDDHAGNSLKRQAHVVAYGNSL